MPKYMADPGAGGEAGPWASPGLALIFDMDGVIVNSNPVHREAWKRYNLRFGIVTDEAMLERMYGKHNDDIVRDYFGDHLSAEEIAAHGRGKERLYREMMASRLEQSLVPGIRQFLARHAALPLAVATNAEPANVSFVLDAAGMRESFRIVVDGAMASRPKPAPDIYMRTAELLGFAEADCIVFEDSVAGIQAARGAGMRTVGVLTTHTELPGVDLAVRDFRSKELEPWLRSQTPLV
jgi:beta-phosphoglucomutase family hydrolase